MTTPTQLYRHFDAEGRLLYVGISLSTIFRTKQHRDNSSWFASISKITIETFPSRQEAWEAETLAIEREKPIFNIAKVIEQADEDRKAAEVRIAKLVISAKVTSLSPVYSIHDAAEELRCGTADVEKLIKSGRLRAFKIGRRPYITGWALLDFLEWADASEAVEAQNMARRLVRNPCGPRRKMEAER